MAKTKVGGGKRYKAATKALQGKEGASEPKWTGPAPPKHVQRKIARKVGFLDRVSTSKSLNVKAGIKKNAKNAKKKISKALSDLSSLSGTLTEVLGDMGHGKGSKSSAGAAATVDTKQERRKGFGESVQSTKARTKIMVQESARMQQVLNHPQYMADPIKAITNHLNATLPEAPMVELSRPSQKRGQIKKGVKGKRPQSSSMQE